MCVFPFLVSLTPTHTQREHIQRTQSKNPTQPTQRMSLYEDQYCPCCGKQGTLVPDLQMGFLECDDPECLAHFPGMVDNGEWDVIHRGQGGRRVEPYGKALGDVETPKRLIDFLHIHSCDPADDASKYGFIGLPMKVACKVLDFLRRLAVVMHYADASFLAQALGYYKQYAEWARLYSEGPKLREPKNSYRYPTACVY